MAIFLITDRFKPFIRGIFAWNLKGQMGKPAVCGSPVPVFDVGRDMHHSSRQDFNSRLPLLLIPSTAGNSNQHLATTC